MTHSRERQWHRHRPFDLPEDRRAGYGGRPWDLLTLEKEHAASAVYEERGWIGCLVRGVPTQPVPLPRCLFTLQIAPESTQIHNQRLIAPVPHQASSSE